MNEYIIAATGHRPDKLGGYSDAVAAKLFGLARGYLSEAMPQFAISGMALGWDTAWAKAAIDLGIPLICAVPFYGQETRWPEASQATYRNILKQASRVVHVCAPGYAGWKMQRRNEWMVDRATRLAALWNGTTGGTANCLGYADRRGCPVDNLWNDYAGEERARA